MYEFTWDSRDLQVWRGGKVDKALGRAVRLAGNQAIRGVKKGSSQYVRSRKLLRDDVVDRGLPLILPGRKMAIRHLAWVMKVSGEPVPLSRFPHVQTKRGVSVRVNVGGGVRRIPHAFTATMRSGHEGVFLRRGRSRLPIQELWTTRLSDTMKDPGVIPQQLTKAAVKMNKAFNRGMDRELAKLKRNGTI